ncbi:MAG: sulfatase-like hydrolase/transferase [Planctomycetota bacterium]|jgi:arylsulfatase|nr:sulfatase-like hydrolase/transferase [Planctomycetota bacterium]
MSTRPNVLWLMADQWHAKALSCCGSQVRTPHLDAIAADGVLFERAFAVNPICGPSRASFLTGQYCHTHGLQGNNNVCYTGGGETNIGALFQRRGWRTALTGKAHLPRAWVEDGFEFIRYTDLCDADPRDPTTCHYFQYLCERGLDGYYEEGYARPGTVGENDGSGPADLPYEHSIERYTGDETLRFLRDGRDDERPFFIKMSFQRPHAPMRPAREYYDKYDPASIELPANSADWLENRFASKPEFIRKKLQGSHYPYAHGEDGLKRLIASYYALIEAIDAEIGRVVAELKEQGLYDNTIICFNADHGDFNGDHGLFHKNLGIYDSIQQIPFILRVPGGPKGVRRSQLIESIDMYPTLCEVAGLAVPAGVEGTSLLPIVYDDAPGRDECLCEWSWGNGPVPRINALRTDRYRLVYYNHEVGGELYDHDQDPGEMFNLWLDPAYATVRCELQERLFDRVNQYACPLIMADDAHIAKANRYTPTPRLHGHGNDWPTLKAAIEARVPNRGPV